MIKLGFLMNLTFLLCIVVTQLLIWVVDGTLLKTIINLLNIRKQYSTNDRNSMEKDLMRNLESMMNGNIFHKTFKHSDQV